MNYVIKIIDAAGEVITSIKSDDNPSQTELDKLVALHGGQYADIHRR